MFTFTPYHLQFSPGEVHNSRGGRRGSDEQQTTLREARDAAKSRYYEGRFAIFDSRFTEYRLMVL